MLADALCLALINSETQQLISHIIVVEQLLTISQNYVLSTLIVTQTNQECLVKQNIPKELMTQYFNIQLLFYAKVVFVIVASIVNI